MGRLGKYVALAHHGCDEHGALLHAGITKSVHRSCCRVDHPVSGAKACNVGKEEGFDSDVRC